MKWVGGIHSLSSEFSQQSSLSHLNVSPQPGRKTLKRNRENKNKLKIYLKNLTVQSVQHMFLCNKIKTPRGQSSTLYLGSKYNKPNNYSSSVPHDAREQLFQPHRLRNSQGNLILFFQKMDKAFPLITSQTLLFPHRKLSLCSSEGQLPTT